MKVNCPHCEFEFEVNPFSGVMSPMRSARHEKGVSVAEAAAYLKISPHTLQALERGKVNPRISVVMAASRLYGKPIEVLFPDTTDDETEDVED